MKNMTFYLFECFRELLSITCNIDELQSRNKVMLKRARRIEQCRAKKYYIVISLSESITRLWKPVNL